MKILAPEDRLKELERARRRYLEPRRVMRAAYREVFSTYLRYAPRPFQASGEVRRWWILGDPDSLPEHLPADCTFTLDSALELKGLRRWSTGRDTWIYVQGFTELEELEGRGLLGVDAQPGRPILQASLPLESIEWEVLDGGRRVVSESRLIEDLLGHYGLRPDLFVRLHPGG